MPYLIEVHVLKHYLFIITKGKATFQQTYLILYYERELHAYCNLVLPIYRVSQEERTKLREGVPYVKLYRYNPKHLCPKLNGFRDNGK